MARLVNMSQEELAMLDNAITPEIANVLKEAFARTDVYH